MPISTYERLLLLVALANEVYTVNATGEFMTRAGYPIRCRSAREPDLSDRAATIREKRLRRGGGGTVA